MIDPNQQPQQEPNDTEESSLVEVIIEEWGSENVEVFDLT